MYEIEMLVHNEHDKYYASSAFLTFVSFFFSNQFVLSCLGRS